MKQFALAGMVSVALHAAIFSMMPGTPHPVSVEQPPATIDIEVSRAPGASTQSRSAARAEPVRRRHRWQPASALTTATAHSWWPPAPMPAVPTPTPNPSPLTPTSAAPATPNGGASAPVPDADLSAFFQRLERAAQRCSGPRAGNGRVRFCVGPGGAPTDVSLVQSTGNFALDDAALHCVIPGAAPFPRTDRCLVVPLEFR